MQTDITPLSAFARYQDILPRLPAAFFPEKPGHLNDFSELVDRFDAVVFDAFGVLNIGDTPIRGAAEFIARLRRAGKQVFVLTNSASLTHNKSKARFNKLGTILRTPRLSQAGISL